MKTMRGKLLPGTEREHPVKVGREGREVHLGIVQDAEDSFGNKFQVYSSPLCHTGQMHYWKTARASSSIFYARGAITCKKCLEIIQKRSAK